MEGIGSGLLQDTSGTDEKYRLIRIEYVAAGFKLFISRIQAKMEPNCSIFTDLI